MLNASNQAKLQALTPQQRLVVEDELSLLAGGRFRAVVVGCCLVSSHSPSARP
jgi:hypothetical protein